uniref:LRR-RLK n=1 Tax=Rhizophora mucronata TaxID=61149 RepID=A0A2P2MEQ6_RHIMU
MLELQSLHDFFPNLKCLDLTFNNLQGTSFGHFPTSINAYIFLFLIFVFKIVLGIIYFLT